MITTVLLCTVALFVWFLVAMYYLRRRHELRTRTGLAYWLLVAAILPGVAFDVIYNWTIGVLLFMDITPDLTLSQRLARYRKAPIGEVGYRRKRWADWICENLLNPYDPKGRHC
ncbi:MAG TPA: hypothetical protein DCS05_05165 [Nitrospiraceae bacterium]|nr:hypothetical protein [Nitrospiraceae bacterium]